ncbi:MAG: hypothetical protein IPH84_12475 [Bacteroidales bacterium]|nr:hypothetical protein [Bacteroidales bacterium]
MKKSLLIICLLMIVICAAMSQDQLKKYDIGDSGCSAYFYNNPGQAEVSFSPDSSKVYTLESLDESGNTYSIIVVDLAIDLPGEEVENILISYLDYLKEQFGVLSSAGYGKGHKLDTHASAKGINDFWSSQEDDISVKAWGDPGYLAVMMVFSAKGTDVFSKSQVFFNGFRFPGD